MSSARSITLTSLGPVDPDAQPKLQTVATPGVSDLALVAVAWLLYALALMSSNVTIDVARDIAEAYRIATGTDFPLRGPMIGFAVYHGPLWFYLLAPAAATGSVVWIAGWVGFLAGSKFLFGWLLGAAIGGRPAGRAMVVALALPAWTGLELLVFSHTNLVATSVLAFAWGCLALWRIPRAGWALWVVAAAVLMLHAHPSTLPWLALALPGLVRGVRQRRIRMSMVAVAVVIGASLFLLPWIASREDEITHGAKALLPARDLVLGAPAVAVALGRALLVDGPRVILQLIGAWSSLAAWLVGSLAAIVALTGLAGLMTQTRRREPLLAIGIGLLIALLVFIAVVRPQTRFYMAYAPTTLIAILIGLGLGRWLNRRFGAALAGAGLALLLGVQTFAFSILSQRGVLDVPHVLRDIAFGKKRAAGPGGELLSPVAADRLARHLCHDPRPLHGPLAVAMDLAYGISLRMHCKLSLTQLAELGERGVRGYLGLPRQAWSVLGREPDISFGQWGLTQSIAVLRRGELRWADYRSWRDYPPRLWATDAVEERVIEIELAPGELLVVTSLEHVFANNAAPELRSDGVAIESIWRSESSSIWSPPLEGRQTMMLVLSGRRVDAFEVVVVRAFDESPATDAEDR